jgi:hypothetical protein
MLSRKQYVRSQTFAKRKIQSSNGVSGSLTSMAHTAKTENKQMNSLVKIIIAAVMVASAYHFAPSPKNHNRSAEGKRILAEAALVNEERTQHDATGPVIVTPSGLDQSSKSALDRAFDERSAAMTGGRQ